MKYIIGLLIFLGGPFAAKSQTAEDSVKASIEGLFMAMKQADRAGVLASFADSAVMQTLVTTRDGVMLVKTDKVTAFGDQIAAVPKGALDERITFEVIKVDGPLATVWTPGL